ncbi:hypothetical protein PHAVU_001G183200 [Phaseolus vulgaris]|uniref:Increased DNA methylation 1 C-terminal domain-containing protein n=1 Tax=Phaseolus vulgaris TaxID=3885 RepID=V7CZW0_PHAVU|nr:hypothetical protein PHAVU_001G183200g [Phaseolus vulgaris]ESW34810.1 hypothetical protein PHAVU_001G183200g [Phaseolus vulgaris]
MTYLKELPEGNWLCCNDCTQIHCTLENLLVRGAERLPESLLGVIKEKQGEKGLEPINDIDAVSIFHECFNPIVDASSGRNLIPAMLYMGGMCVIRSLEECIGYFQTLFSCIERLLAFLNVKNLVLPAAEEAESICTDKFVFSKIKQDQLTNYRRTCNQIVSFKGTNMLHKMVPPCRIINNQS